MKIRRIATRFALVLAVAAIVPLVAYGVWSLVTLQRGTRESIVAGNLNVAERAADEIRRYIVGNTAILKALGSDLQGTDLTVAQQDRVLKNYVLQFREYRELTLLDEGGATVATSRVGAARLTAPSTPPALVNGVGMSALRLDAEGLPTAQFSIRLTRLAQNNGWLVGEISLEEMWRMVDEIRIGERGFALVLAPDGALIAHGSPDRKALIAEGRNERSHPLLHTGNARSWDEYTDDTGTQLLGVAAPIDALAWTVIVEQPTDDAYANARRLTQQLGVAAVAALLVMLGAGFLFGGRFIAPIFELRRGTQALARGEMDARVQIDSVDEFGQLGQSFNSMADRLVQLQEDVKRQERQAMFGRVVGGLFHDLNHPIQNIGNNARLLLRPELDDASKAASQRTIDRELGTLKRFMDDVLNIAKPRPLELIPLDVNRTLSDVVDAMRAEGERSGVRVIGDYGDGPLTINGDPFALGRVYRNLIKNAIQATGQGGSVTASTRRNGMSVEIAVADTGSGIPVDRLGAIFDDFVTTKSRGLGLGLATSKRIVEQLQGTITVESRVGHGTTFTVRFAALEADVTSA